jgi:hypothetical protein
MIAKIVEEFSAGGAVISQKPTKQTNSQLAGAFYVIGAAFAHIPLNGSASDSSFGRLGPAISYGGPLFLVALVLLAQAIRHRAAQFALAAGVFALCAATTAYLLKLADPNLYLDTVRWIGLLQINAIVAAAYAILWIGATT